MPDEQTSTIEADATPAVSSDRNRDTWCVWSRCLVAAGVLWLLFSIVRRLLSGRYWMGLILDLAPPLLLVVAPLCIFAALLGALAIRRRVPRMAFLVTATASLSAFLLGIRSSGLNVPALWSASDSATPPGAIKVFAWNTQYWGQGKDREKFFRYLQRQHADIYLLQEYVRWNQRENVPIEINDIWRLRRSFPGYDIRSNGELVTISRYPILKAVALDLPNQHGADFATVFADNKIFRTDVAVGSSIVSFYNVHIPVQLALDFNAHFFDDVISRNSDRRAQYRLLREDVSENQNPFLVAGDFNTSPSMGDLTWFRRHLTDPTSIMHSVYPTSWQDSGSLPRWWRLDWAFTSAMRVHEYRFQTSEGLSDHRSQQLIVSIGRKR